MGSRFNIVLPLDKKENGKEIFHSVQKEVLRIDKKLSYFNEESTVYKINQNACKTCMELDNEMIDIIQICIDYSKLTYGAYDITLRPVIEKTVKSGNHVGADDNEGKSYLDKIVFNKNKKTIFFESNKVKIDLGGFGKGYALEKIKPLLDSAPIENAFVSFGESSILVKGKHPGGKNWQVGIKDLTNKKEPLHTFHLFNNSISSSSNYYVNDSGQLCRKINVISPFTYKPVEEKKVTSVQSVSPLQAEILSTAFLVMNENLINRTLKKVNKVEAVVVSYHGNKSCKKTFRA